MKFLILLFLFFLLPSHLIDAQNYEAKIEWNVCPVKIGEGIVAKCGKLVVPENRKNIKGNQVKIPFIYVRRPEQDSVKNISLFTTGGPGYSTIVNINQINATSGFLKYGGFIAFDQRGTQKSDPVLNCPEIDEAVKKSYRENLSKEDLTLDAVKKCHERLSKQGIDLSAYNTTESVADINDLRKALHIESLNLVGISYSGGLMLTVARNHPEGVKLLILNSPLPTFVNYEEHGLYNINEALDNVFSKYSKEAGGDNLKRRFQDYFTGITGKRFTINFTEKATGKTFPVEYGKSELLDVIINRMNESQLPALPGIIDQIIRGKHDMVKEILDQAFDGNPGYALGMRYSVYCSGQIAYADPKLIDRQTEKMPWFSGYVFNNVNRKICSYWKVRAEPPVIKTPVRSYIPALLSAGEIDPWCRPSYNRLVKKAMPNSQMLLAHKRGHGAGFVIDGVDYLELFMKNPEQKLKSVSKNVEIE